MNVTRSFSGLAAAIAAMAIVAAGIPAAAAGSQNSEAVAPAITLRVYDYAQLDRRMVAAAENEASRILSQAGVSARWVDCPTSHSDIDRYPDCKSAWEGNGYTLQLLPKGMAEEKTGSPDAMGAAYVCDSGSCMAKVFCDRVAHQAGGDTAPTEIIMGRVIAHEIGHLLLGQNSHARTGIMKATWTDREMSLLDGIGMHFTEEQSRTIASRLSLDAVDRPSSAKASSAGQ